MNVQAGIEVLKSGGNAADAIAVMQFMLGVVQPHSTGIGGGCFVLLYNRCHLHARSDMLVLHALSLTAP